MNYQYIEQLLERYWECQTTLEEEAILRAFFTQDDIPASLLPYRDLFLAEANMSEEHLGEAFDRRIMSLLETGDTQRNVQLRPLSMRQRLRPFYRAAAIVAIVLTIGMAAQQGFETREHTEDSVPRLSVATAGEDTLELFTDMTEEQQTTVLAPSQTDSLRAIAP